MGSPAMSNSKYIKEPKDEYPLDFFGYMDGQLPKDGDLYFIERRLFNISFLPIVDAEVYLVRNGKWVKGKKMN